MAIHLINYYSVYRQGGIVTKSTTDFSWRVSIFSGKHKEEQIIYMKVIIFDDLNGFIGCKYAPSIKSVVMGQ